MRQIVFDPREKDINRFYTLDERVPDLFKSGNLNPGLLMHYIDYPDRTVIFNNPNHPATRFAIQAINLDFKEMKYKRQELKGKHYRP